MTDAIQKILFVPNLSSGLLLEEGFGRLTLRKISGAEESVVSAQLLDTFDQDVRRSGFLLIAPELDLLLLGQDGCVQCPNCNWRGGFVSDMPEGAIRAALDGVSSLRALMPICQIQLVAGAFDLIDEDGKIEARCGFYELSAEGCGKGLVAMPSAVRGYDNSFSILHERLVALGACNLKQADIYAQFAPASSLCLPKPLILICNDEAAMDVATDIMASFLPIARSNELGIINDIDTEFLHDYRIALRKVRSVLSLFKGVYGEALTLDLKKRFSAVMAVTGPLRDLDVYLLEKQKFYDLCPPSLHGGLDRMFEIFAKRRNEEARKLAEHLASEAYDKEMKALTKLLSKPQRLERGPNADLPAHDYASRLIWKRYRKICKIAKRIGPDSDDSEVHQLRIHCKKLRYLMEFFAPVFPDKALKGLIKPLKRLQDNLGNFNDCSVQIKALNDFLAGVGGRGGKGQLELAQSVGALIAVLHQRQTEERGKVVENFALFHSDETEQIFQTLFHEGR